MTDDLLYAGREQTLVKHFILEKYLQRFARIVGSRWEVLTYVDCFSGPWNVQSEELKDSSFDIALNELRKARDEFQKQGRSVRLRSYFLEKNGAAYARLKQYAESVVDAGVETRNDTLENSIENIIDFVQRGGKNSFPFIFIDPTGWTGFAMDTIAPLLRLRPGEVLINFMTGHIRRFLDSPQEETQESFRRLFGDTEFREKIRYVAVKDREDFAIEAYVNNLKRVGGFRYACIATVLHPKIDRTHFHLIYATRSSKGVEVFKEAEKRAMPFQEVKRAEARSRSREERSGQMDLLEPIALHTPVHYHKLRERYLKKSLGAVEYLLQEKGQMSYEQAWEVALAQPMTWESDLKEWIADTERTGKLEVLGLREKQRVPHRDQGNVLRWKS